MKYILPGIMLGVALSFFLFRPSYGTEIYSKFHVEKSDLIPGSVDAYESKTTGHFFIYNAGGSVYKIDGEGNTLASYQPGGELFEISGNGRYYASYGKVGTEIELKSDSGARFWKIKSREKPLLSCNGRLILLINGDHSKIRILDRNSNLLGVSEISGRLCTTVVFSELNDYAAAGFADGSYYFLNDKGEIISEGMVKRGSVVKSLAISNNGKYGLVHYGDTDQDHIRVIDIVSQKKSDTQLSSVQRTRAALSVNDMGLSSFLDSSRIIFFDSDGDIIMEKNVPVKRMGFAKLKTSDSITVLSYGRNTGGAQFYLFKNDGVMLFSKRFSESSYLDCGISSDEKIVTLTGQSGFQGYELSH